MHTPSPANRLTLDRGCAFYHFVVLKPKGIPSIDKKYFIGWWFYFTLKRLDVSALRGFSHKSNGYYKADICDDFCFSRS